MHDSRGRLEPVLADQLKGYSLEDPATRRACALPSAVVELVARAQATELHRAVGQLVVCAFFFAMRSCEYCDTKAPCRTKAVIVGDVVFRSGGKIIDSYDERELAHEETVSVTYRTQKNRRTGTVASR